MTTSCAAFFWRRETSFGSSSMAHTLGWFLRDSPCMGTPPPPRQATSARAPAHEYRVFITRLLKIMLSELYRYITDITVCTDVHLVMCLVFLHVHECYLIQVYSLYIWLLHAFCSPHDYISIHHYAYTGD